MQTALYIYTSEWYLQAAAKVQQRRRPPTSSPGPGPRPVQVSPRTGSRAELSEWPSPCSGAYVDGSAEEPLLCPGFGRGACVLCRGGL
jgi:hypothetical protein